MVRKSLLQGVSDSPWGCIGDGQKRGASPTEGDPEGAGRIASRDGGSHARDQRSTIGLVQTVLHSRRQEIIVPTVDNACTSRAVRLQLKSASAPAHLGRQDCTGLRGRQFEVGNGHNQCEFRRKGEAQIAVLCLDSIR